MHPAQNLVVALCVAHARLIDDEAAHHLIGNLGEAMFVELTSSLVGLSAALLGKMTPQERDEAMRAAQVATHDIVKNWEEYQPHRWN